MIATVEGINQVIRNNELDTNLISDKYHTFGELYDHRIVLFINLCLYLDLINKGTLIYSNNSNFTGLGIPKKHYVWRSKKHSDNSEWNGWFIMGIDTEEGEQISYHLPISYWENTQWVRTLDNAPTFDGHTSTDVLERLKSL